MLLPDNPAEFANYDLFQATNGAEATLGAQAFGSGVIGLFGALVSSPNNPADAPSNLNNLTVVPTPAGMTDTQFIEQLLGEAGDYANNLRYDPFPTTTNPWLGPTYNSNSFVSGLLKGAGAVPPTLPGIQPGYGQPIPLGQ